MMNTLHNRNRLPGSGARRPWLRRAFVISTTPIDTRLVRAVASLPDAAPQDSRYAAPSRLGGRTLWPRRTDGRREAEDNGDNDSRPSTSGRDYVSDRDRDRKVDRRRDYPATNSRRPRDDDEDADGLSRGGRRSSRGEGDGRDSREYSGPRSRGEGRGRPRERYDGDEDYKAGDRGSERRASERAGGRPGSRRGERRERSELEARPDRGLGGRRSRDGPSRRGNDSSLAPKQQHQEQQAAAESEAGSPAAATAVPRPPGSSTGNKPLPYDLPIVRPYDVDKGTFFAGSSWKQVGASDDVIAALRALGVQRPSHIQAQAFTSFLGRPGRQGGGARNSDGDHSSSTGGVSGPLVLGDQAGSGKTLAYLLPVMQLLKQEEAAAGGRVTKPRCPRAIVVAPTVELVQQVLRVVRALSGAGLRCRSAAVTGGQRDDKARAASYRTQRDVLSEGVDLLVATPGRLQQHLQSGNLQLGECRALVMDEVDVLLGDRANFLGQVGPLRAAAPPSLRFVLVTATLPQHVFAQLREVWPDLQPVFGPGLHRTASGLVEELVDCSGGDEISEESGRKRKLEALKELLERHRAARTMVFCNKIDACRDVENFLTRVDPQQQNYRVLPYHEAIRDELRAEHMTEFLKPVKPVKPQPGRQSKEEPGGGGGGGEEEPREVPLVLVATDRTSRGIDVLYCEHVVLFDFPRDPSEYVRRVGRTARGAGGTGTVSSLVLGRQVPLAREIIERNQKGMPVHSVPA